MSKPIAQPDLHRINPMMPKYAPWEQYKRPYVRDLAYVLACPNVLTQWVNFAPYQNTHIISVHSASFWQAQFEAYQERLEELDTTSAYQDLTRYLLARPSPNRLGFHFEGLLSFWLTDGFAHGYHPYEILASNVQLYCGKQTSGELDLVLYNHQEKLTEHWELAVKFFMGSAPFAPVNWVGINSKDNLQRKMTHMQTKQFLALYVDTESHGRVNIDKRYAVIKGRFFLPMLNADFIYPDWFSNHFPLHRWMSIPYDQNNRVDHDILELSQSQAKTNNFSGMIEPFSKAVTIRRAHYIEWFTQRNFYNKKFSNKVSDKVSPTTMPFCQGLYFVQSPLQPHYEPVVMLYKDVARQDKG